MNHATDKEQFEEYFATLDAKPWPTEPKEFARTIYHEARETLLAEIDRLSMEANMGRQAEEDANRELAVAVEALEKVRKDYKGLVNVAAKYSLKNTVTDAVESIAYLDAILSTLSAHTKQEG